MPSRGYPLQIAPRLDSRRERNTMKTIRPMELATLIARREPFDLIDVRTRKEFDKGHIPGARLIPLPELRRFDFLQNRRLAAAESVYVICRSHVLASLASGALEAAGHRNAVVVEGGMEVWEAEGLPVLRTNMVSETYTRCADGGGDRRPRIGPWSRCSRNLLPRASSPRRGSPLYEISLVWRLRRLIRRNRPPQRIG